MSEKHILIDQPALLAMLAEWWESPERDDITGRVPERLAGSQWDQPLNGAENPYWEIVRQLPCDTIRSPWSRSPEPNTYVYSGPRGFRYFADRRDLQRTYAWSIPTPGDIAWIRDLLIRYELGIVEIGAGSGYWAWQMRQAGLDVMAYDPHEPGEENFFAGQEWSTVLRDDASAAKHHPDRALFLSWPSYSDPWAAHALACYRGNLLIYAGEGDGGCCADDEFFRLLEAEWEEIGCSPKHVSFSMIHCYLIAYRRK